MTTPPAENGAATWWRYVRVALKIAASVLIAVAVFTLDFDSAFFPHPYTMGLSLVAALILFFVPNVSARVQSWSYLLLVLVVPLVVPRYLLIGTLRRGWPWPYPIRGDGAHFFGTYEAAEQARMVGLIGLVLVGALLLFVAWWRWRTLPRQSDAH